MKDFYLLTLGCPKNEVESEALIHSLLEIGLKLTLDPQEADLIIVNTCGFLKDAVEEAKEHVSALSENKKINQKLVVFGCLVQRFNNFDFLNFKKFDYFSPSQQDLIQYLSQIKVEFKNFDQPILPRLKTNPTYAYLTIADGCSRNCSFCTLPQFKGPYKSKSPQKILEEIEALLLLEIKEIILIAQDTTYYGKDLQKKINLSQLLKLIFKNYPQIHRLRIMYAHPSGINDELIETFLEYDQICHYLDLPLQHTDPNILKLMNRPSNIKEIEKLIKKIRIAIPDLCFRSSFIIGFPGEKEKEFQNLLNFLKKWKLDKVGFFAFSPEIGTKACSLPNQISKTVKQRRIQEAYLLQQKISFKKNQSLVEKTIEVLTERRKGKDWIGRSYREAPEIDGNIFFKGKTKIGDLVEVKIESAKEHDLEGKIIS